MNKYFNQISSFIDAHKDEIIEKWKTLVNLEGHYNEKANVEKAMAWVRKEFEQEGFECYIHDLMPTRAGVLVGILGKDRAGGPVIFSGHIDTVHHAGAFGKANPFEIKDGKAHGPGVLDMKGGVVMSLYVVKALNAISYNEHPIKIVFTGEEESDHIGNNADEFFTQESLGGLCAFNMETGHIENRLCIGRKTQYTIFAKVHGLGGHAGNEFTKGKNAVHEAIYKCSRLMELTDLDVGTTVTVSVINSGGNTNSTSIPDLSEFVVDIRVFSNEIGAEVLAKVDQIMHTDFIQGTTTEYHVDKAKLHPFNVNPKIQALFDLVNGVAVENGFKPFGTIRLGGASDAGAISEAGIPVLCSCGPIGEFNHNIREYAVVQSMFDRAKIYATAVTELDKM